MERKYSFGQQCMAFILLVSLFLQSCSNFSKPITSGGDKTTNNVQELTNQIDIVHLADEELTAEGGYLVTLYEQDRQLMADVRVNETQKEPNYKSVPVRIAQDIDLTQLPRLNKEAQKRLIHFSAPKNEQLGSVSIIKSGLLGGMMKEKDEHKKYEEDEYDDIPDEFICPISQEIMKDPVIAKDGHTYDRSSIEKWFNTKGKPISPKTNEELSSKELIPNYNLRKMIQDFKEKHKRAEEEKRKKKEQQDVNANDSTTHEIILFCGNPGVGKSSLCNSIFKEHKFESGVSLGGGMTQNKQEHVHENKTYIDTPGLSDINRRKEAAEEIEAALKKNNNYKVIFVITLEAGRFRADDFATINTICEAITVPFEYGIIINKVSNAVGGEIKAKGGIEEWIKPYLDLLSKKVSLRNLLILKKDREMDDVRNVRLTDLERIELINFISKLEANNIKSEDVQEIDVTDYKKKVEELEEKIASMYSRGAVAIVATTGVLTGIGLSYYGTTIVATLMAFLKRKK